ncbi:MAG: TIGR03545 family protein [Treponema sp.]|nr:TIGR03545 family protein [Treponema sp.]
MNNSFPKKIFNFLNKYNKPTDFAHAITLGFLLGFIPKNNLLWFLFVAIFLFTRINIFAFLISLALGTIFAPIFDPLFCTIGNSVLTSSTLENFFSNLLDIPFVFFTKINNTLVCGSLVFSLAFYLPIFFIALILQRKIAPHFSRKFNLNVSSSENFSKQNSSQKNKFFIRFAPLFSCIIILALFSLSVMLFKNVIAKKIITSATQAIFQAKTDIANLDLDLINAKLNIKNLEQANKYNPMKNLFQIGDISFDLNLNELLRGKFDAENVSVSELSFLTERKTSGAIKLKKSNEELENEKFIQDMQNNLASEIQTLLTTSFQDYNPEHIIQKVQTELTSPTLAEKSKVTAEELTQKWKDVPLAMEKDVTSFVQSVESLCKTDWQNINDKAVLQQALIDVNSAITKGKKLKTESEKIVNNLKADTTKVSDLSKEIILSVKNDKERIQKEINKFNSFKSGGIEDIFNKTVDAFMYNLFGVYYPYVQEIIDASHNLAGDKSKKNVSEKKNFRMKGKDIFYKKNTVPKILIEKLSGSGTGWNIEAKEISSDQNIRGKASEAVSNFLIKNISNTITAKLDTRENTQNNFFSATYSGNGFPIALNINDDFLLDSSTSVVSFEINGNPNGSFGISGTLDLNKMKIKTKAFEPESVYSIYQNAIEQFTMLKIGTTIDYDAGLKKLQLFITTDAGKQLASIFQNLLAKELTSLTNFARQKIESLLSEKTSGFTEEFSKIMQIENSVQNNANTYFNTNEQLEKIKNELSKKLAEKATSNVQQKANEALKNIFGR